MRLRRIHCALLSGAHHQLTGLIIHSNRPSNRKLPIALQQEHVARTGAQGRGPRPRKGRLRLLGRSPDAPIRTSQGVGANPIPTPAELETTIWAQAAEAFRPTDISSSTASPAGTCLSCAWHTAAGTSRRYSVIERGKGRSARAAPFAIGAYDNNIWPTESIMSSNCHGVGQDTHRFSNVTVSPQSVSIPFPVGPSYVSQKTKRD
jgi:hypothetical protein